jgi:flavin reductase (DIM6/NTAB) family NADH-FMN oxidoreductase RutF
MVGVKAYSRTYKTVKAAQAFALKMLGKEQKNLAFTFFRPVDVSDGKLSGQSFRGGATGAPILVDAPGAFVLSRSWSPSRSRVFHAGK